MFCTIFILHILQKGLLVLGSLGCLMPRMDICSLVPLPKQSQRPEMIEDVCGNEQSSRCWSQFGIIFGHHLSRSLHSKDQVLLPLGLHPSQSLNDAIHVIEHVILHCVNMVQCDCMPVQHPLGPISEWREYFQDILDNRPFILCCEEWLVMAVLWILEPLTLGFH